MINFTCPECREPFSVTAEKSSGSLHCPHCDKTISSQDAVSSEGAAVDSLITGIEGGSDPTQASALEPLSIEGLLDESSDQDSWYVKCHVCDSVLTANKSQLGSQLKCNDCYTLLDVVAPATKTKSNGRSSGGPGGAEKPRFVRSPIELVDGSNLEVVDDDDELTLLPPVELPQELLTAQKESLLQAEDAIEDAVAELETAGADAEMNVEMNVELALGPLEVEGGSFELTPAAAEVADDESEDDDDSDETIELLDIPAEIANRKSGLNVAQPASNQDELPYIPRQKKHQPKHQPKQKAKSGKQKSSAGSGANSDTSTHADDSPIRVHAKKRKSKPVDQDIGGVSEAIAESRVEFASLNPYQLLDRSMNVLKSGNIWIGAVVAIALMSLGSAVWHGAGPGELADDASMVQNIMSYLIAITIGQIPFLAGYLVLMYLSAVVFRETALGNDQVESLIPSDAAAFFSTMLLFGFSMFMAALPFVFLPAGLWVPLQFFLAGVFLFCVWQNKSAFAIVSGSVFTSFSQHSASWKTWAKVTSAAAGVGWVGGCLMTLSWPVMSIFTSIAGAVLVTLATLFYATIPGWHAGGFSESTTEP